MASCASTAGHSCSSCRSSRTICSYIQRFALLLLLLTFVCGFLAHTTAEGLYPRVVTLVGSRKQQLAHQQQPQQEQPLQKHKQKLQQLQQQHACAATPLNLFDLERVSEVALSTDNGKSQSHAPTAILGLGGSSSPPEGGSKAQQLPEEAPPPAASGPSESRKPQHQQGNTARAVEDSAYTTAGLTPGSSVNQQPRQEQEEKPQQQKKQRNQRPHLNTKTSGVFIAFKQLAAAAAAGAVAATRKRPAVASGSGLQLSKQWQKQEQRQGDPLSRHTLQPLSRSSPPGVSEHRLATQVAEVAAPYVAAAAAAATADATAAERLAIASSYTRAAHPIGRPVAVGLRRQLKAGQWQQQQEPEAGLSAACSSVSSTVWLTHLCYSLGSCTTAPARGVHGGKLALRGEATTDVTAAASCQCVAPRMPVLLHDQPVNQTQREQQQQQLHQEGATRAIPVLQQQQLLLCCTEGTYPLQLGCALQLGLQHHLLRACAAEYNQTLSPEAPLSLLKEHPSNGEQGGQNPESLRSEATPPVTSKGIAEKRNVGAGATELAAAATDSFAQSSFAIYGAEQQQYELQLRQDEGSQYLRLPSQPDGVLDGQQKQHAKGAGEKPQPIGEKHQKRQEQEQIHGQGEVQRHELSSRWGGQLVSWTWRRSCMRQRQLSKPETAAAAEAAAVTAAALCYRPPAPTSLALQILLLLLPHDLAVRLLAGTNTAQCQQPPQQQQLQHGLRQQTYRTQQGRLFRSDDLENDAVHRELHQGSCAAPVKRLGSVNSFLMPYEDPNWSAVEFSGTMGMARRQQEAIERLESQSSRHIHPLEQQKHEQLFQQDVKQQQVTQQQQTTDGPAKGRKGLQEGLGCQKQQRQQQDAQPVECPQRHGYPEHEQQQQKIPVGQQQQADMSATNWALPGASTVAKLHANAQAPLAKSAVGGAPGAPQLYGRGFVQGEQLPASFLRLHFNFASLDAGARIIASSPGMQHIKAVQRPDADTYMLVPCYLPSKYFVLSFSETLKIDFVVIQSFEIYANAFWHIQLLGADTYPTRQWRLIGNLQTAPDVSSELFDLKSECAALSSCWAKFLKVRLLTHHDEGPHYYCSLTSFQVFGATGVQFLETQIHDEFGDTAHGAEGEVFEGVPSYGSPRTVSGYPGSVASDESSAAFASKDFQETVMEASLPLVIPQPPGSLEGVTQQLESVPAVSDSSQYRQQRGTERGGVAELPQQLDEVQGRQANDASLESSHRSNPVPTDITVSLEAENLHSNSESSGAHEAYGEPPVLHGERQRRGISVEKHGGSSLDIPSAPAAPAAISADPETEAAAQRVAHQQQQLHNLLRAEELEKQSTAALNALSGALEKAWQQQRQLLLQKRQGQQRQQLEIQHHVPVDDPTWAEVGYPSVSIPGLREVLSFTSSLMDSAVCTASSSNNARSLWQAYNPLIQPTTSRYICIPLAEGTQTTGAAATAASANKPKVAQQVHLVAANGIPSKSTKQLQVADAATEALRQAATYARAFLLDALQHQQQPQLQQSPIGAAFLRFLMTTTPGEQDQRAETLRVLSLLLQPPSMDVKSNAGGASGEATRGGVAAAPPLGPRDTKGEHVLVMLLERMKSLEGETAAFKAAAAERQQQLQLQQQHLLHLALLVQLQQQLGSFLFERLAAFDGLIPHLNPLIQLLDESEAAATSAAAAAQEGEMPHGTVAAEAAQHLGPHCSMTDGNTRDFSSPGQQKEQSWQQQHCRHTARHRNWGWPWELFKQQLFQLLEWVWRWLALPLIHWGSDGIFAATGAAKMLQQQVCSGAESTVVQQSCAAASSLCAGITSIVGTIAHGATVGAGILCRGISAFAAHAATAWIRLFAAVNEAPHQRSHDWSTGSTNSSTNSSTHHWTERLLTLQERGTPQGVDSSTATHFLLLLVCFLAVSSAFFWRLRRGQRIAAAAAGECALLRRSFELLQQQHQALLHQLQQCKREQQLLLLLAASHHSSSSSRMLLHHTKYEAYGSDVQQRQRTGVQLDDPVKEDISAGIARALDEHQCRAFTEAPQPLTTPLTSQVHREAAAAPETTPSLLRRLSTSLAPRVFLGRSRNAGNGSYMGSAKYGNGSSTSSNPSADSAATLQSPGKDNDSVLAQRQEIMLEQQEDSCGSHEQQPQQEQQVQFAAAALLPALDTRAIRSLKLQRHTLRQRRQGGATTPVASPAAAGAADGDSLLLSPSVIDAGAPGQTQNAYVSSGPEAAAVAASSAAPSRSSSSRSSSVCSASGNIHGVASSYLKSVWASHLIRSGTIPHASISFQSTQRQMELHCAVRPRDNPDAEARASSNLTGSCSTVCMDSYSVPAAVAASHGRNLSCGMPVNIPAAGRSVTGGDLADQFRAGADGAQQAAHGGAKAPVAARHAECVSGVVPIGANEDTAMPPAFAVGSSTELQQAQLLQPEQLHLQAALASSTGRDGRRRRKKRGVS